MSEIQKIDPNFYVSTAVTKKEVAVYDVCKPPFCLYGLLPPQNENDCLRRMPRAAAEQVSGAVGYLHRNTAGGRIRFSTDSGYFGIHAEIIKQTVDNARAEGDDNVYFVDGLKFEKVLDIGGSIVVDGVHPNDLGFYAMAQVIGKNFEAVITP